MKKFYQHFWIHIFTLLCVLGYALIPHQGDYADSVVWVPAALQAGTQAHDHNSLSDFQALLQGHVLTHGQPASPLSPAYQLDHPETYYGVANIHFHFPPHLWDFPIEVLQAPSPLAAYRAIDWPKARPPTATTRTLQTTILLI